MIRLAISIQINNRYQFVENAPYLFCRKAARIHMSWMKDHSEGLCQRGIRSNVGAQSEPDSNILVQRSVSESCDAVEGVEADGAALVLAKEKEKAQISLRWFL